MVTEIHSLKFNCCMKKKILHVVDRMNAAKHITNHLIGEQHTSTHRKFVGSVIVVTGYSLSKIGIDMHVIGVISELFAHYVIGIGLIPFLNEIEHKHDTPK